MTEALRAIEREAADYSRRLASEAAYYWERHQPRYRYLLELLEDLRTRHRFERILDVGMGFQTRLLSRLFPDSRVDCLGVGEDGRFRPAGEFTFYPVDLNEAAARESPPAPAPGQFDLIVFMEVLEHLYTPPETILRFLASRLRAGGIIVVTTPNAAWLKNRIKLLCGKNPFELLKDDRKNLGHIREYTRRELERSLEAAGLEKILVERRGLYRFNNAKDNFYSRIADWTHPALRRTLVAVYRRPGVTSPAAAPPPPAPPPP